MINETEIQALQQLFAKFEQYDLTSEQLEQIHLLIHLLIFTGPDAALTAKVRASYPKDIADTIDYLMDLMVCEKLFSAQAILDYINKKGKELADWMDAYVAMTPEERRTDDTKRELRLKYYRSPRN